MSVRSNLTLIASYKILTPADVRFLSEYADWAKKGYLAERLERALQTPAYLGTFASEAAVNAGGIHPGFSAGSFVPGDRYYDSGASKFKTNTGTTVGGAATWTAES